MISFEVLNLADLGQDLVRCGEEEEGFQLMECDGSAMTVRSASGAAAMAYVWHDQTVFVSQAGRQTILQDQTLASASTVGKAGAGLVRAPMAGRIVVVQVTPGQQVAKGAPLVVLEAMKMEHPAFAPFAGIVKSIDVQPGAQVAAGALLVELEASP